MNTDKDRILDQQQKAAGLMIWKTRLPSDDGFRFVAAKRKPSDGQQWYKATPNEILMIAARALEGLYD